MTRVLGTCCVKGININTITPGRRHCNHRTMSPARGVYTYLPCHHSWYISFGVGTLKKISLKKSSYLSTSDPNGPSSLMSRRLFLFLVNLLTSLTHFNSAVVMRLQFLLTLLIAFLVTEVSGETLYRSGNTKTPVPTAERLLKDFGPLVDGSFIHRPKFG